MEQVITRCKEFQHIKRAKNIPAPTYPQLMPNGINLQVRADFSLKANFRNQWFLSDTNYICQFVENANSHRSAFLRASSSFLIPLGLNHSKFGVSLFAW